MKGIIETFDDALDYDKDLVRTAYHEGRSAGRGDPTEDVVTPSMRLLGSVDRWTDREIEVFADDETDTVVLSTPDMWAITIKGDE